MARLITRLIRLIARLVMMGILAVFIFVPLVAADATISGTTYDIELRQVAARVMISTVPEQMIIAADGVYSFIVPAGQYVLRAEQLQKGTVIAATEENITVTSSGSYTLDLLLFPTLEEDGNTTPITEEDIIDYPEENGEYDFIIGAVFVVAGLVLVWRYYKKKKEQPHKAGGEEKKKERKEPAAEKSPSVRIIEEEKEALLAALAKVGGRATQKDLRKDLPYSEAKVSLILAELEHDGRVKKIKQGRGNIVVMK